MSRSTPFPDESDSAHDGRSRLWYVLMLARVLLGVVLLLLHFTLAQLGLPTPGLVLPLCGVYLGLSVLGRIWLKPPVPGRQFDRQWLPVVGVDIAFFALLQLHPTLASINYTPLLALPVMSAAVLSSRTVALGTAALVALLLLADALWPAWMGKATLSTAQVIQSGVSGAGLLMLAWLVNQMATRLAREQAAVRRSRLETQVQTIINGLVLEALPSGVLVVDARLYVRAINPAARTMLGLPPADGKQVRFSLKDYPALQPLRHLLELSHANQADDVAEVLLHHEGRMSSRLQVRLERTPAIGETGVRLSVLFLQDLREMEARLRTEKLASMGRMSAAVAHEIRNPLAAISQANALLEEDLDDPAERRLTTMVRQNVERLQNIVDDVLDVARVQEASDEAEQQHPPALTLDAQAEGFVREWAQHHQAGERLQQQWQTGRECVQFMPQHLRRILVNLLDNAARYATRKPGAIQVQTQAIAHGPLLLSVWSDGPPIEASVQRHLFEPFFSSESRSSGLGLFICRELCERHGASMGYERATRLQDGRPVQGNSFYVSFRRAELQLPAQVDWLGLDNRPAGHHHFEDTVLL